MESTELAEGTGPASQQPDPANMSMIPKPPTYPANENQNLKFETKDDEALDHTPNPSSISTINTESEAIMRYILLLERTQSQLQRTEKIMDKLSGQLGSAIAVTESLKSKKLLEESNCEREIPG